MALTAPKEESIMSVHFHLMTVTANRHDFAADMIEGTMTAPTSLGLDSDLFGPDDGVHWSQAFVPYLMLGERAEQSEGQLWVSDRAGAQVELAFMIGQITTAMQYADPCANYYASRAHFAKMLCLLHAAQMYSAIHPEIVFEISWF
jgi:hypothetical protein